MEGVLTAAAIALLVLLVSVIGPLLVGLGLVALARRWWGSLVAAGLAATLLFGWASSPLPRFAAFVAYVAVPEARIPLVGLDLAFSRGAREDIVRRVEEGSLQPGPYSGELELPAGSRGLSVHGTVERIEGDCGFQTFFMTLTGFSPDPYAGLEFVPAGCTPEVDPLGSGQGRATDLGEGWFWIEAS